MLRRYPAGSSLGSGGAGSETSGIEGEEKEGVFGVVPLVLAADGCGDCAPKPGDMREGLWVEVVVVVGGGDIKLELEVREEEESSEESLGPRRKIPIVACGCLCRVFQLIGM